MSNANSYTYSVYGLKIKSSIKLPGFVETEFATYEEPDVRIVLEEITESFLNEHFGKTKTFDTPECEVRVTQKAMCFAYPKTGTIFVEGGRQVILDIKPEIQEEEFLPYLTGYVLAILLHQRKYLVLHASVMLINGVGVAFLGAKGFGKSTLAASLEVLGHRLISDDLLPIIISENATYTFPGYPLIKLHEDSLNAVGANPADLRNVHRNNIKYSLSCTKFSNEMVPLSAIYVLNIEDQISIENISMPHAFIEATTHTHINAYLEESESLEWHFELCRRLVEAVPFFQLSRPHDFNRINEVTGALEKHVVEVVNSNVVATLKE